MLHNLRTKLLLSLALGAFVFIGLTIYADASRLADAFRIFGWEYLPLIVACTASNYLFRYFKWDFYTRALGVRPATGANVIIFFSSFMMAVTPGKLGEVLKSYLLKEVNGTPVARSAPIILAERLTDFLGLIVIMIAGAFVFGYARVVIAVFAIFFSGLTVLLAWRRGSLAVLGLLARLPLLRRYAAHARDAYDSMYILVQPRTLAWTILLSVVSWAFECLGYWIILNVFHAPPTPLKAAFIYAFSTIVGAVTMMPGGLGGTEGSLTGLAQLAGVTKDIAVASTFIIRVATLWFAVILGIVVTFAFQKRLHVRLDALPLEGETGV